MNRLDYQTGIEVMIENACNNLSAEEFEILKQRVIEMVQSYE